MDRRFPTYGNKKGPFGLQRPTKMVLQGKGQEKLLTGSPKYAEFQATPIPFQKSSHKKVLPTILRHMSHPLVLSGPQTGWFPMGRGRDRLTLCLFTMQEPVLLGLLCILKHYCWLVTCQGNTGTIAKVLTQTCGVEPDLNITTEWAPTVCQALCSVHHTPAFYWSSGISSDAIISLCR